MMENQRHTTKPVALTIAGSDSGGGAGIQADIKAMEAHGVFSASVLTAITAQNTVAVTRAFDLPVDLIQAQLDAVFDDIAIGAVKTGMLSSAAIIEVVAGALRHRAAKPLVVDPVMISTTGFKLISDDATGRLISDLFPLATLLTPNAHEAAHLTGRSIRTADDAREAARRLHAMGPAYVLVKGGHLEGETDAIDILYDGAVFTEFSTPRIDTPHTHGTGCTYASAIAALLARGFVMEEAVGRAKRYVTEAIRHGLPIGRGHGPTNHFYFLAGSGIFPADGG
ncbi:MAG: bifunctional hydroxymethylpyrimidine kinase/phosphomethylpyrimidine kinase [Rhodothermales bacterium]|nr:bifunctional hydroxymethylpyrimidine kinase/phosphomethylpyrimidine kinase [Rhodothermales bacterium]